LVHPSGRVAELDGIAERHLPGREVEGRGEAALILVALEILLGEALRLRRRLHHREVDRRDPVDRVEAGDADLGIVAQLVERIVRRVGEAAADDVEHLVEAGRLLPAVAADDVGLGEAGKRSAQVVLPADDRDLAAGVPERGVHRPEQHSATTERSSPSEKTPSLR
jgi:hypothetical protein